MFLKDISKQTVADLINYIYCGQVNVKREYLEEFMSAAAALKIKGLADGNYSHSLDSRPTKPTNNGSTFQSPAFKHSFDSSGIQYQSSAQSTHYQQPMQMQDELDLKDQHRMNDDFGYELNYDQNYENESSLNSMDNYDEKEFGQADNQYGSTDNDSKTMAMAPVPKRYKMCKG